MATDQDIDELAYQVDFIDIYKSICFLAIVYISTVIASRILKVPGMVGAILSGIVTGPPVLDLVPNPAAFVMIGQVGLVLFVLEAGIDINLDTLKQVGKRGFLIGVVGGILPMALGTIISILLFGPDNIRANVTTGAVFGSFSFGIALNNLKAANIIHTPVGQLIIATAVIDDMIALIVLSQLQSLVGRVTAVGILLPVVSALAFLFIGGYIALYIIPVVMARYVLPSFAVSQHSTVEMYVMTGLLLCMMPATHYARASYLMGAFLAGLAFCTSNELQQLFANQSKRTSQWLLRIFFAASIGFQVPMRDFGNAKIWWHSLVLSITLLGKVAAGFLVPVRDIDDEKRFTGTHLSSCLIAGLSMAAEGEFSLVIASFAVEEGLIDKDLYASVVLTVLLSEIVAPVLLRYTISHSHYHDSSDSKEDKDRDDNEYIYKEEDKEVKASDGQHCMIIVEDSLESTDPDSLAASVKE